jgi:uncharacterized protein with FMN-binding domain
MTLMRGPSRGGSPGGGSPIRRHKLAGSLVAIGSAAVVSVYTVGYISTQSSIDDLTAQLDTPAPVAAAPSTGRASTAPTATPVPSTRGAAAVPPNTTTRSIPPTPTPTPSTSASATAYKDGTYTGTGTSRHGDITVEVVITNGEIVSASVARCQTRYPCSDVNPLISAVLTDQSVPHVHVSGATDSSTAYKSAVTRALQQALAGV